MDNKEGKAIHELAKELWPIGRSITGQGVRHTLDIIAQTLPELKVFQVASGTDVFDWVIPKEWQVNEAYIIGPDGQKFCNYKENNLHLVGYSTPINKIVSLSELQNHLYSRPDLPNAVPYVTSYYEKRWGFCISHNERLKLVDGDYKVVIETRLFEGFLNYGEVLIKGKSEKEIFLSSYICHPSMANNELSGPTVLTYLTKWLLSQNNLQYSYRIIFVPETIGAIAYLSKNLKKMKKLIIAGFNLSCLGDTRAYSYVPSRMGGSLSDKIAKHVLKWIDENYFEYTWSDRGSDERQYCSPGVDLPIATICRSKYGAYPEYHTSLDDLETLVTPEGLQGGFDALKYSLEAIEKNIIPKSTVLCEPQLGKRGLYPTLSNTTSNKNVDIMMDLISWSDGKHTLLEVADKINVPVWDLYDPLENLMQHGIIDVNFKT